MRRVLWALLAGAALLPAGAVAQATLNKCIDAAGNTTYSNLPCRNAQQAHKVELDPAPSPDAARSPSVSVPTPDARTAASPPAAIERAPVSLETRRASGKPVVPASSRQCDTLTDKLGTVLDKMDVARRKGYTQKQMDAWNADVKELERKKQQSRCF